MRDSFLVLPEDIQWLKDTHLKGVPLPTKWQSFTFAVVQGNEDSPFAVNLYLGGNPLWNDDYYRIRFINSLPIYCECAEFDGNTDKEKT